MMFILAIIVIIVIIAVNAAAALAFGRLKASDDYDPQDDFAKSLEYGYEHIRNRVANGGPRGFMDEPK